MMSDIEFFEITYHSVDGSPPIMLLCQSLRVDEERLLWIDGINELEPVVLPLAGVPATWAGTFSGWLSENPEIASQVVSISSGISPLIVVRSMAVMLADKSISADTALELCLEQGKVVLVDDQSFFSRHRIAG